MRALNNIRNVDKEKYLFDSSLKWVFVQVSPSLIACTFSLETPKKLINFYIPKIDIKAMSDTTTKELYDHSFQLGTCVERSSLLPKYRILSLILFHTILNKKGHLNELTLYVLYILFHMARCFKLNLSALICHNMIEAQCSNVNTCVTIWFNCLLAFIKCRVGFQVTALWLNVAHATYVHYDSMLHMQPTCMKQSMKKQMKASSSRRSSKSSQLGDIYTLCK